MSQDDPTTPPAPEAPKRKKGFWSWLSGSGDHDAPAPAGDAAPSDAAGAARAASAETDAPSAPEQAASSAPSPLAEAATPAPAGEAPAPAEGSAPPAPAVPAPDAASADVPTAGPDDAGPPLATLQADVPAAPASAPMLGSPAAPATASGLVAPPPAAPVSLSGLPEPTPTPAPVPAVPAAPGGPAAAEPAAQPAALSPAGAPVASPAPPVEAPASEAPAHPAVDATATASDGPASDSPAGGGEPAEASPVAADAPSPAEIPAEPAAEPGRKGFWSRLVSGLARTAGNLGQGITDLVSKRKLDADTLEELEDVLIRADLGTETSARIVAAVGKGRHDKMISPEEVKGLIAQEVETILAPVAKPLVVDAAHKPFVVLMVGVNGSGKTTTIGKLAAQWRAEGRKVVLAAGDTFRAAAIEQLKVWGQRTGAHVIAREQGADAAGVAHDALTEARAEGADILMVDTAGRLQNRAELMAELEKVVRVIRKLEPTAPHAVLLVLDATVGQNALSQVEAFTRISGVTGLVMTKLDGTARGGILVAIAAKHKLPVHLIGVGEGADDLQPFAARDFARAIAGLD